MENLQRVGAGGVLASVLPHGFDLGRIIGAGIEIAKGETGAGGIAHQLPVEVHLVANVKVILLASSAG